MENLSIGDKIGLILLIVCATVVGICFCKDGEYAGAIWCLIAAAWCFGYFMTKDDANFYKKAYEKTLSISEKVNKNAREINKLNKELLDSNKELTKDLAWYGEKLQKLGTEMINKYDAKNPVILEILRELESRKQEREKKELLSAQPADNDNIIISK